MKTDSRERLSIDLEAYPDVKEMLKCAREASGKSNTDLTILSLKNQLPAIVDDLQRQRCEGTKRFREKYPRSNSNPSESEFSKGEKAAKELFVSGPADTSGEHSKDSPKKKRNRRRSYQ